MSDEAVELRIQQGDCTFGKNWEAGEYISRKTWWTEVKEENYCQVYYTTLVETWLIWPAQYCSFIQINQISKVSYKSYKNSLQTSYYFIFTLVELANNSILWNLCS